MYHTANSSFRVRTFPSYVNIMDTPDYCAKDPNKKWADNMEWRVDKQWIQKNWMKRKLTMIQLMVLKRNPPGYFMFLYMKIWPDAYFYLWNFEKKSSNAFETRKSKFLCFCTNKNFVIRKPIVFQVRALLTSNLMFKKIIVTDFSPKSLARLNWTQKHQKQR